MSWRTEWDALGARIDGLMAAGHFLIQALQVNSEDTYAIVQHLSNQAIDTVAELEAFKGRSDRVAPAKAIQAIDRFIETHKTRINDTSVKGLGGLKARLTPLAWLKAEVDYHLRDFEAVARRLSERAFLHLQQSIVADEVIRERWRNAFDAGETSCEKLGGAHLLLHGILAFKITGAGARTDLVFGEPFEGGLAAERAADALVLTEWKVVRKPAQQGEIAASARQQAELYQAGILGGLELRGYRYIVLVSKQRLPSIDDVQVGPIIYRHLNVAVNPEVPSKATN
jgi:hypothetical protein